MAFVSQQLQVLPSFKEKAKKGLKYYMAQMGKFSLKIWCLQILSSILALGKLYEN